MRRFVPVLTPLSFLGLVLAVGASRAAEDPAPPAGQTYTGAKKCASCHFKQFMTWKKDKHSKVFDLLPDKYKTDATCLKCHSTGYGTPTGFKDIKSTPDLAGNTCEICHGPGSEHEKVAQKYGKEKLTAAQEKEVRDSMWLMLPENVCVKCHLTKAHKESATPPELRAKD